MRVKPYIGVTGVISEQEVNDVIREFNEAGYKMNFGHVPMLGYLVSYKTLTGQETKNRRYPKVGDLHRLVGRACNKVLTMIHYNSREMPSLVEQIEEIFYNLYNDNLCRALQLNIIWPDIEQVRLIKQKFPEMLIVFQASHKVLNEDNRTIIPRLKKYGGLIDYVLIDPSGGRSLEFSLDESVNLYRRLKKNLPEIVVGFAGGFNPENIYNRLRRLVDEVHRGNFCIDAEGGLRNKITEEYGDDILNIEKVRRYLREASQVIS